MKTLIWHIRLLFAFRRAGWSWKAALLDALDAWKWRGSDDPLSFAGLRREGFSPYGAVLESLDGGYE